MRLTTLAVTTMLALGACTQTSAPEISMYEGRQIQLEATATPSLMDAEFILKINGQEAINDRTQPFGGSSQTFQGAWNGLPVTARVTQVQQFISSYVMVDVFINGQMVDTLTI